MAPLESLGTASCAFFIVKLLWLYVVSFPR